MNLMIRYIRIFFFYLIIVIGTLAIAISLLSLLYDVPLWWIKILDFPRQMFLISLLCLLLFILTNRGWSYWPILFCLGLLFSAGLQAYFIFPYTPLAHQKAVWATPDDVHPKTRVSLLVANVYMKNRNAEAFLQIISKANPDMLLAMETDQWWEHALEPVQEVYPYSMEYPLDNTYGMLLYSKYALIDPEIKFLQHEDVPSFHTKVKIASGALFYFHGVHPVPPFLSEYPDNIGEEEEELLEVGDMIESHHMPTIVAGDFNDVAWSQTSRLFQIEGQLNDLRIGRGFYNTFNAHSALMRWPLDHVYVTDEFEVLKFERLAASGSDHFPLYVELVLRKKAKVVKRTGQICNHYSFVSNHLRFF